MSERLIIKRGIVVTMDKDFRVIEDGSVVIEEGKIIDVGKTGAIEKEYKGDIVIDASKKAVLPGIVNSHFHSHVFSRGIIERIYQEKSMDELLKDFYYPLLEAMTHEDVYSEASLAYVEAVRTGTTCVNNMYRHVTACADAAEDIGIRVVLSSEAVDLVKGETLDDNEKAFLEKHNSANGRVKIWFGVEWVPVCSPEFLRRARDLANKYKTGIHIHLNESVGEIEECKKLYKKRPIEHVYDLNVLGPDCIAAHCVHLTDEEIRILKETGTHVAHCPISNMKWGNGFARIPDIMSAGVNVGLGTDAYENNFDMFEVMKYGSYVHKGVRLDISTMSHEEILKMATVNGAKALGLEREIGSIERGKKADIILLNLHTTRFGPVLLGKHFNLLPNLTYAAHGDDVEMVIIDGKVVMENRKLKTVDEEEVIEKARNSAVTLLNKII